MTITYHRVTSKSVNIYTDNDKFSKLTLDLWDTTKCIYIMLIGLKKGLRNDINIINKIGKSNILLTIEKYVECSALTREGVENVFYQLI